MKILGEGIFEGGLVLPTYSRPNLLEECLKSIYGAENSSQIAKIVVLQLGDLEVEKLVHDFKDQQTFVIPIKRTNTSPLFNMNYNWWVGASFGFEILGLPWLLSLEEESVLKGNAFNFALEMHEKYESDRKFRGVNLSTKLVDESNRGTYSLLRYGFMGSGATILSKDWQKLKKYRVKTQLQHSPWDVFTEAFWKTGFRSTPNLSMVMNFGWIGGTHTDGIQSENQKMNQISFQTPDSVNDFQLKNIDNGWINGSRIYDSHQNYIFNVRFVLWLILDNKFGKPIYKRLVHYLFN
jgi:hypothetical protein